MVLIWVWLVVTYCFVVVVLVSSFGLDIYVGCVSLVCSFCCLVVVIGMINSVGVF